MRAQEFIARMKDVSKRIEYIVDQRASDKLNEQKYKVKVVIETILLCGREDIALRGSNDSGVLSLDVNNPNEGNLRAMLRYRANGDENLRKSLENTPKNATYLSPRIQNELIEIIGEYIQMSIVEEVKRAVFFSVLADETTDISGKEQLSICIRFFDKASNKIKECFLSYVE
ncbi:52 kDa repressor of the inhibitor of the protein kinase-like, partial [Musca vetustissima]|uniref:52 kDa repressor of the inhibitor of the protein kinase-like n=1 Tax=Musca vetustissima TaxID=27455 RepID=UPI002AB77060